MLPTQAGSDVRGHVQYRREIDGLRAVAVLPVVFFHAGLTIFAGGFVGVDIFFVISGYLITGILIRELEDGNFSILRFYERRARRILPALFFVMLCCLAFAWAWMLPEKLVDFSQSMIAVSLFASNILFWRQSDYFEPDAEQRPLLHTWSLAVEEQYYIFFPIFLLVCWRFGRNPVFYAILVFTALSLAMSEWGWRNAPSGNFYLAPTRAWELLAGSICAFLQFGKPQRSSNFLSAVGLALILYSIFAFDESVPFPSLYALAPVGGTGLIILYASKETWVAKILSTRGFVGIGLISYSAYLWHQPLFAFARIRSIYAPEQWLMMLLAVLAFGLAAFSWRYVEQPFRKKGGAALMSSQKVVLTTAAIGCVVFMALGGIGVLRDGMPGRFTEAQMTVQQSPKARAPVNNAVCAHPIGKGRALPQFPDPRCEFKAQGEERKGRAVIIGDSHATEISASLIIALTEAGYDVAQSTIVGCNPFVGYRNARFDCGAANEKLLPYLEEAQFDIVIASFRPHALFMEPFDNGEGGHETDTFAPVFFDDGYLGTDPADTGFVKTKALYEAGIARLLALESETILIYPIPEAGWNVRDIMQKISLFAPERRGEVISTSLEVYLDRNRDISEVLNGIIDPKLHRVKPHKILCDSYLPGRCMNTLDGVSLYRDDDHLSDTGAQLLVPAVLEAVSRIEQNSAPDD